MNNEAEKQAEENFRLNKRNFLIVGSVAILYGWGGIDVGPDLNAIGLTIKAHEYTLPIILTVLCIYLGLRVVNFTFATARYSRARTRFSEYRNEYGKIYARKYLKNNEATFLTDLKKDNPAPEFSSFNTLTLSNDPTQQGEKKWGIKETRFKIYLTQKEGGNERAQNFKEEGHTPFDLWGIWGKSIRDLMFQEPACLDLAAPALVGFGLLLMLCKITITWAGPLGAWFIMWLTAGLA